MTLSLVKMEYTGYTIISLLLTWQANRESDKFVALAEVLYAKLCA